MEVKETMESVESKGMISHGVAVLTYIALGSVRGKVRVRVKVGNS